MTPEREARLRLFATSNRGLWFHRAFREVFAEIDRLREREISLAERVDEQAELNREP